VTGVQMCSSDPGFDSKVSEIISIPRDEIILVKLISNL